MYTVTYNFPKVTLNTALVAAESSLLADRLAALMVGQIQIALLLHRKKVTGETLQSVRARNLSGAPDTQLRQVIASGSYRFIVAGTGPAAGHPRGNWPLQYLGTGPRGGKRFEPVPALMRWFVALNIPKSLWFPIIRKIATVGIKPTDIPGTAMGNARPFIQQYAKASGVTIARGLIKVS